MSPERLRGLIAVALSLGLTLALVGFITFVRNLPPPLVTEVGADTFKDVVMKSPIPVYVEFYSKTNADCKAQAPIVEKLAKEYQGKVRFIKVDFDKNTALAKSAGVLQEDLPAHFLLKPDRTGTFWPGPLSEADLRAFIEVGLKKKSAPAPKPGTNPAPKPGTNPAPKPGTNPAPQPGTNPAPKPATEPATKPSTEPATKPSTEPATKPSTEPATKPSTEPATKPSTE